MDIAPAADDEGELLRNLMQFYLYDFTEFTGDDVPPPGRWEMGWIDEFLAGAENHAFVARVDGHPAGLALVEHRDGAQRAEWDMLEFFVLRKYRRSGAGTQLARAMFDRFPGRWEVRVLATNTPAQAFWRRTIEAYTGAAYEERDREDGRGIVFFFDSARSS